MPCTAHQRRTPPFPIAIDGTAGAGKSTLGAALAKRYGYRLFDTGVTYRAYTLAALERAVPAADEHACVALARELEMHVEGQDESRIWIDGQEVTRRLREPAVEASVSEYSAIPGVRQVMVTMQRDIAERAPSVVVGRDIGSAVLPEAPVKLFLTASDEERARRRAEQSGSWGLQRDPDQASGDINRRDTVDSTRGGLRRPPDAVEIDTTTLTPEQVVARAVEVIECGR